MSNITRTEVERRLQRRDPLRNLDLSGMNLEDLVMVGADLRYTNLAGANLNGANLSGAMLEHCSFSDCEMIESSLQEASLVNCNLDRTNLHHANLIEANLREADMLQTNLSGANLDGALVIQVKGCFIDFSEASCYESRFDESELVMCDFSTLDSGRLLASRVDFTGSVFNGAKMDRSVLIGSNMSYCDLTGAFLRGCKMHGINFFSATLKETHLTKSNLEGGRFMLAVAESSLINGANLKGANLIEADFSHGNFDSSFMVDIADKDAKFDHASFKNTKR